MGAVTNLNPKGDSPKTKSKENPNPSGSTITALMMIAVLATVAGIVFHFLKKKKTKEIEDVSK